MNRRNQALANREDLLNAAEEIFRQHSVHVPLQKIISHAGVGRATFYRNFADRRALIEALLERSITRFEHRTSELSSQPDGLIQLIKTYVHRLPDLILLTEYWRMIDRYDPFMIKIYERRNHALQPLINNAIFHQLCRDDLTPNDFSIITAILGYSFQGHDAEEQEQLAERAIELLLHGIYR